MTSLNEGLNTFLKGSRAKLAKYLSEECIEEKCRIVILLRYLKRLSTVRLYSVCEKIIGREWSTVGMTLTVEHRTSRRRIYLSATLSTTYPTWKKK